MEHDDHVEGLFDFGELLFEALFGPEQVAFHELVLLVEVVQLSEQIVVAVFVHPGFRVVDESHFGDLAVGFVGLADWRYRLFLLCSGGHARLINY